MSWKIMISLLVVLAVVLGARSLLGPTADAESTESLAPAARAAESGDPRPSSTDRTTASGRAPLPTGRTGGAEPSEPPRLDRDGPPTAAERLARLRELAREEPAELDRALDQVLDPNAAPLSERVAVLHAAWIERVDGWDGHARAVLAADRTGDGPLGRAVQRWAAEDAAHDPVAREFLEGALWGEAPIDAASATRRRLARALFAHAPDHELARLQTRLHGESDREVLRSALLAWARRVGSERAGELFGPFGFEPPADLDAVEGD